MKSAHTFCYWLLGMLETYENQPLPEDKVKRIREELDLVFQEKGIIYPNPNTSTTTLYQYPSYSNPKITYGSTFTGKTPASNPLQEVRGEEVDKNTGCRPYN